MDVKPGYKQTEVGVIPEDWEVKTLKALNLDISDGNYSSKYPKASEFRVFGVPFIRANNVRNMSVVDDDLRYISESLHAELQKGHLKKNDILVTTRGEIGQIAFVPDRHIDSNINAQLVRINPSSSQFDHRFVGYLLAFGNAQKQFENLQTGSALKQLPVGRLTSLSIPIPPTKAEQEAIAEALSDADALIESLEQLLTKKRQIKTGVMQELLTGRKRLPGFSGEWEVKRLGEIAELKNGYAFKSITYTTLGNFNVITISNVQDGYMDVSECNKIDVLPCDLQPYHRLGIGDVLISMTGNVGRVCRVNTPDCVLNQRVGKLVPSNVDAPFLFLLLCQRRFLTAMAGKAKGGAQGNLSVSDITEFMLRLPPNKTEQSAIATILSDMDAEITALEAKLVKACQLKQGMMQELLTGRIRLVESGKFKVESGA